MLSNHVNLYPTDSDRSYPSIKPEAVVNVWGGEASWPDPARNTLRHELKFFQTGGADQSDIIVKSDSNLEVNNSSFIEFLVCIVYRVVRMKNNSVYLN